MKKLRKKKKALKINGFRIQPKMVYEASAINGNGAGRYGTKTEVIRSAREYDWFAGSQ